MSLHNIRSLELPFPVSSVQLVVDSSFPDTFDAGSSLDITIVFHCMVKRLTVFARASWRGDINEGKAHRNWKQITPASSRT